MFLRMMLMSLVNVLVLDKANRNRQSDAEHKAGESHDAPGTIHRCGKLGQQFG